MPVESTPKPPVSLCEKYRPETLDSFVGLAEPKRVFRSLAKRPRSGAWLFLGRTRTGKTAFALAVAHELRAQVHHLSAPDLTRDQLNRMLKRLALDSHALQVILIDEADNLSLSRQLDLRHPLDNSPGVIWIFTALSAAKMDEGFSSRCMRVNFSAYGSASESAAYLERIWRRPPQTDPHRTSRA